MSEGAVPRVGVLGGTFNPIHLGHLLLAHDVAEILALDRVIFVPAGEPPHKPQGELAPVRHRYAMTALAMAEHARFEVSDVELGRPGPSYTVDTLEILAGRGDLVLLMGSETFLDLLTWREPLRLVGLARLGVIARQGTPFTAEAPVTQKVLTGLGLPAFVPVAAPVDVPPRGAGLPAPLLLAAVSLPISASDCRRRARDGQSLAFRVPAAVAAYIGEHGLYRTSR